MKKYILSFLTGTLIAMSGCKKDGVKIKQPEDFQGKKIAGFGNSIMAYRGTDSGWFPLLCVALNATPENEGRNGQTVTKNPCQYPVFNKNNFPRYDSTYGALLFASNENDIGFTPAIDTSAYKNALMTDIDFAIEERKWPPEKIYIFSPYYAYSYKMYVGGCLVVTAATQDRAQQFQRIDEQVASQFGTSYFNIRDPMNGLDSTFYLPDQLHPNLKGQLWIANYLIGHLDLKK